MRTGLSSRRRAYALLVTWSLFVTSTVSAQLVVTEVMFDPNNDGAWEWIEVRNDGASAVDLNGAYAAKLGGAEVDGPAIDGSAGNTVIPGNGGVAVIYDANLGAGNPASFDDQFFRDAWGLGSGVSLIGASNLPALSNQGDLRNFAFWANQTDYGSNIAFNIDTNMFEVVSINDNIFSLDYRPVINEMPTGFPTGNGSASIRWNGNGNYRDGTNWDRSEVGQPNVVTSVQVTVPGNTNSTADVGNPGVIQSPSGPIASGLLITEIMYNPASPENNNEWEWVEIYNNTGGEINFGTTPYILDDDDLGPLGAANITSGTVADGTAAVLFNSEEITLFDMQTAWDNGNGTNFIGVTDWPGFSGGGDLVALWSDFTLYTQDETAGVTTNAVVAVDYDDNPNDGWPVDNGEGSIYLNDLSVDAAGANTGSNWRLSAPGDGLSFNAAGISGTIEIHPGGDVGSPGSFEIVTLADVDLDDDLDVDGQDFLMIQRTNPAIIPDWVAQYGGGGGSSSAFSGVPEPTSAALLGLACVMAPVVRRQRG